MRVSDDDAHQRDLLLQYIKWNYHVYGWLFPAESSRAEYFYVLNHLLFYVVSFPHLQYKSDDLLFFYETKSRASHIPDVVKYDFKVLNPF